jgi:uridine phosphorylase
VVNELVQVGVRTIIRIGTCGSIQAHVLPGSVVISSAALARQGAANDIAPPEYPASANPFLTVALVNAAKSLNLDYHVGITASVDTFFEGQERISSSANPHLLRWLHGMTEEYRNLNIINMRWKLACYSKWAMSMVFRPAVFAAWWHSALVAKPSSPKPKWLQSNMRLRQQCARQKYMRGIRDLRA